MTKHPYTNIIDIRDTAGNQYSGELINQMDEMPDGVVFETFVVAGGLVHKLPRNLRVKGDLNLSKSTRIKEIPKGTVVGGAIWLEQSQVEVLPVGLQADSLSFSTDSLITHIPDDIRLRILNLQNSNIKSIGRNIECTYLYVADPNVLTNTIKCDRLTIEDSVDHIDLKNARMTTLNFDLASELTPDSPSKTLCNVKAKVVRLLCDYATTATWTLIDSKIDQLLIFLGEQSLSSDLNIVCGLNVECKVLEINGSPRYGSRLIDDYHLTVKIDGARIDRILVQKEAVERTRLTGYVLCHDLVVASPVLPDALLSTSLIYGNLTIPYGFAPPSGFNALGEIYRV